MAEGEDEYELTPHKQLEQLRQEIDRLKSGPKGKALEKSESLQDSVDRLNTNVEELLEIFKFAKENTSEDESHAHIALLKKLDIIIDDNKKIAQGIVAVADMVKKYAGRPQPQGQKDYGSIPPPLRAPPRQMPPMQSSQQQMQGSPQFQKSTGMPSSQGFGAPSNFGAPPGMQSPSGQDPFSNDDSSMPDLGFPPPPSGFTTEPPKKKGFFGK